MMSAVIGAIIIALPAVILAALLFWRSLRPVFWFVLALIVVGSGYLVATGAAADIGHLVVG